VRRYVQTVFDPATFFTLGDAFGVPLTDEDLRSVEALLWAGVLNKADATASPGSGGKTRDGPRRFRM
jgi:hypothetical protein